MSSYLSLVRYRLLRSQEKLLRRADSATSASWRWEGVGIKTKQKKKQQPKRDEGRKPNGIRNRNNTHKQLTQQQPENRNQPCPRAGSDRAGYPCQPGRVCQPELHSQTHVHQPGNQKRGNAQEEHSEGRGRDGGTKQQQNLGTERGPSCAVGRVETKFNQKCQKDERNQPKEGAL